MILFQIIMVLFHVKSSKYHNHKLQTNSWHINPGIIFRGLVLLMVDHCIALGGSWYCFRWIMVLHLINHGTSYGKTLYCFR